jgi:putative PEP-CTERM system histidine kinase
MWASSDPTAAGIGGVGFVIAALAYGGYAVYLLRTGLLQPPRHAAAWLLALATLASVGWAAAGFADGWSTRVGPWHASLLFDQLRYVGWTCFMLALLGAEPLRGRRWVVAPVMLLAAGLVAQGAMAMGADGWALWLRGLHGVQLAWAVLALVLLEQLFRNQSETARWSAKPLCLGLAAVFVYDVYLYAQAMMLGAPDPDVIAARGIVHAAAVPLLVLAAQRNGRWLSGVRVSKGAAFYSAGLLLIGVYLLFVAGAGYYLKYFGGTWGGALQVALMAVAVLLLGGLVLSGSQRARVRVLLSKHFFRYRYDYRVEWLRFTAMLSSAQGAPQELGQQVIRGLADLVESPAGTLWLRSTGDGPYVATTHWNRRVEATEPADSAFCEHMRQHEWIVNVDDPGARARADHPAWLTSTRDAWLVIPLLVGEQMHGFVLLAQPRTPMDLNWEVRDLLKTAARQAAGVLALMHATEALVEARKFDAFNRMSAFVVHDLKNIVTQLALMLKNAERHRANPEFQQDMLMTVGNALDKMRQLMLQLREGERPEGSTSGVDLASILARLQDSARRRGRELELQIVERLSTRGHEQRLERVIDHVVQNAFDATPPTGRVWVTLQRAGGRVSVVVGDTGSGMTQEFIQSRLFRPFSSTKAHGMGIGTYESLQYLKELGGAIDVDSEPGRGTVITLTMPLFEHAAGSRLAVHTP